MRRVLPLLAVLPLAFAPAPRPKPADHFELRRLQGEWVLIAEYHEGKQLAPRKMSWVFRGRGFDLIDHEGNYRWDVTLDPRAKPKAMDQRSAHDGAGEVTVTKAVYQLEGGTLTTCYDMTTDADRPRDLSGKHAGHCLQVFKRKAR